MRLQSLNIKKLHGFLDISITFYDDLTVIVGVNGSGKTSALTLMSAILRLDIMSIRRIKFDSAELKAIGNAGQPIQIEALNVEGEFQLTLFTNESAFDLSAYGLATDRFYVPPESAGIWKESSTLQYLSEIRDGRRYAILALEPKANKAAKEFITQSKLTFVQLDRTIVAVDPEGDEAIERFAKGPGVRKGKAPGEPIEEVLRVTKQKYLEYKSATEQIKDRAYRDSLRLHFEPISAAMQGRKKVDRTSLTNKLADMKARVNKSSLTSDETELKTVAVDFFLELEKLLDDSTQQKTLKRTGRRTLDEEQLDAILSLKHWQIERLLAIFEEEAKRTQEAYAPIRRYLSIVDRFFRESGKQLLFDDVYELGFVLGKSKELVGPTLGDKPRSLKELSSGERQILIILTYLAFVSGKDSVFVIDEPELSLHLVWQRLLIEAVKELRPSGCQVILATHAPEIAGRARDRSIRLGNKSLR